MANIGKVRATSLKSTGFFTRKVHSLLGSRLGISGTHCVPWARRQTMPTWADRTKGGFIRPTPRIKTLFVLSQVLLVKEVQEPSNYGTHAFHAPGFQCQFENDFTRESGDEGSAFPAVKRSFQAAETEYLTRSKKKQNGETAAQVFNHCMAPSKTSRAAGGVRGTLRIFGT
ncbi:hypothetical protein C8R44DRAFT_754413 [Mycena epipterygia]|nr:hypothetical protein C8R44DRAFT_754413 [Mycena epipterygia]